MGYSKYPNELDNSNSLPPTLDLITPVKGEVVNRLRDAILAMQSELGINPSSVFGTVKDRIDAIDSDVNTLTNLINDSNLPDLNTSVTNLQSDVTTIQGDITSLQSETSKLVSTSTDNAIVRFDGTTGSMQDSANGPFVTDLGNLGIGTNNPATALEVVGIATLDDIVASGTLSLGSSVASTGTIRVANNSTILVARNAAGNGDANILSYDNSNNLTIGGLNNLSGIFLDVSTGSAIQIRTGGNQQLLVNASNLILTPASFLWASSTGNAVLSFEDNTTGSATGSSLTVRGQDATGATSTGGDLVFRPGSGTSSNGSLNLQDGTSTTQLTVTDDLVTVANGLSLSTGYIAFGSDPSTTGEVRFSNGFIIAARNTTDTDNITIINNPSNNNFIIGGTGAGSRPGTIQFDASTSYEMLIGGSHKVIVDSSNFRLRAILQFDNTETNPTFRHQTNTTNSHVGGVLTVQAQDATGTSSTGGGLTLRSGDGTSADGDILISKGTTTSVLSTSGTEVVLGGAVAAGTRPTNAVLDGSSQSLLRVNGSAVVSAQSSLVTSTQPIAVNSSAGTVADAGDIRLRNAGVITARNAGNSANYDLIQLGSSVVVGDADVSAEITSASIINLRIAGVLSGQVNASGLTILQTTLNFSTNFAATFGKTVAHTSGSGTSLTIVGQDAFAGSNGNGGDIVLSPGLGDGSGTNGIVSVSGTLSSTSLSLTDYLAIGTTPADAGDIRLRNTGTITARNAGNSGNITLISSDSSDNVLLGYPIAITQTGSTAAITVTNSGGTNPQVLRLVNGTLIAKFQSLASSSLLGTESSHDFAIYTNNTARLTLAATGEGTFSSSLALNSSAGTVATVGDLRVRNGFIASARNALNNADLTMFTMSSGNSFQIGGTAGGSRPTSIVFDSTAVNTFRLSGSDIFTTISGEIDIAIPLISFRNTVASPILRQDDDTTASATGDTLLIQAQNATGTTSTGGSLILRAGSGTSSTGTLYLRDGNDNNKVTVTTELELNPSSNTVFRTSGTYRFAVTSSELDVVLPLISFRETVASPIIRQDDDTTASAVGDAFTIRAQDCTGTTSTGGGLTLRSGDGTSADGDVLISKGTTTSVLSTSGTEVVLGGAVAAGTRPTNVALDGSTNSILRVAGTAVLTGAAGLVTSAQPIAVNTAAGTAAPTGDIRLRNTGFIAFNDGASGSVVAVQVTATPNIIFGSTANNAGTYFDAGTGHAINFRPNAASTSYSFEATRFTCAQPIRINTAAGSTATAGDIRLRSGGSIQSLNNAGSANITIALTNTADEVRLGHSDGTGAYLILGATGSAYIRGSSNTNALITTSTLVAAQVPVTINAAAGDVALTGDIRLRNASFIGFRNNLNSGDISALNVDSSDNLILGASSGQNANIYLRSAGNAYFDLNGSIRFHIDDDEARLYVTNLKWTSSAVSPTISHVTDSTNGVTGDTLTIQAQDCTGTTSTGGNLNLRSGTGTVTSGDVLISGGTSNTIVSYSGSVNQLKIGGTDAGTRPSQILIDPESTTRILVAGTTLAQFTSTGMQISSGTSISFDSTIVNPSIFQATEASLTSSDSLTLQAQTNSVSGGTGGLLTLSAGDGTNATTGHGGNALLKGGTGTGTGANGNIAFHLSPSSFQSGQRIIFIANTTAIPTGDPASGGFLFVEAGSLKYRGSSGTVTTLASA